MKATVSAQDKDLTRIRAYKVAAEEMGVRQARISVCFPFHDKAYFASSSRASDMPRIYLGVLAQFSVSTQQ